jgi:hypothetical protein
MNKKLLLALIPAVLGSMAANAQSNVTTGTAKNVVVHEGTGAWCGWCVDGALRLEQMTTTDPRIIGVAVHNSDGMDFGDGNTFNNAYAPGYPYGTVDVAPQTSDPQNMNEVGFYRGYWQTVANARKSVAATYQLTMTHSYVAATRTITATVTGKALSALTGSYNFNVYVVEDSVTGPNGSDYSQKNFYANNPSYTTHPFYSQPATINGYVHNKCCVPC